MAIPGIPSGENHSCASQQCGRKRSPLMLSSPYRRWMASSSSVPCTLSFKSQNRRLSNWSSDSVSHAYCGVCGRRAPAAFFRVCSIFVELYCHYSVLTFKLVIRTRSIHGRALALIEQNYRRERFALEGHGHGRHGDHGGRHSGASALL